MHTQPAGKQNRNIMSIILTFSSAMHSFQKNNFISFLAKAHWVILTTRSSVMKHYAKSVILNLNVKAYISPNVPVNTNSNELSHGIQEVGWKTSATQQTAQWSRIK